MPLLKDRHNLKLVAVAAACLTVGLSAPAVSHGVHAQFAHNADKVDGRHAVGASATPTQRKGKLVATGTSGRLPNNIIAKPPDADRVDGLHAHQLTRAGRVRMPDMMVLTTTATTYGSEMSITAPRAGFVVVNAVAVIDNPSCTLCLASGQVRHTQSGELSVANSIRLATNARGNLAAATVFPVNKGVNTFELRVRRGSGGGSVVALHGEMNGLYVPFGHKGGSSLN